jgi:uncharacterized protein (TIRG00374 family)
MRTDSDGKRRAPVRLGLPGLPERMRSARHLLLLAFIGLALVIGVVLLSEQASGYGASLAPLGKAQPAWLIVALVAEACSFMGYVWTFRAIARFEGGPDFGLPLTSRLIFASLGAGRVFAGGGAAGIGVDFWALRKTGLGRDQAAVRLIAFKVLLFCVFVATAWLCALALLTGASDGGRSRFVLPWFVGVPAFFLALIWLRPERLQARIPRLPGRWLRRIVVDTRDSSAILAGLAMHPRRHGVTLLAGLVYWVGDAACLWASVRAFGVPVPPAALGLAYATGYLVTLLPLPLGGVGSVEAAMTLALVSVGVSLDTALLGVVAYRVFSFWIPTLPGLAAVSTLDRLGRRLERRRASRTPRSRQLVPSREARSDRRAASRHAQGASELDDRSRRSQRYVHLSGG